MTFALLSDIHSNYHALSACVEDALEKGAEGFIFLGDYVSDLSEPERTLDLIYELRSAYPTVCLLGNRERYMLECKRGERVFSCGSKSGSLLYTYEHLRARDFEFFESLKPYDTLEIEGVEFELAHATAENDRHYFDTDEGNIDGVFAQMKHKYLFTGHSHKQYISRSGDKTIINPGSVGVTKLAPRRAHYAILDISDGDIACTPCEVAYDIKKVIHAQFENGLVDYAKYWAIGVLYDVITGEECVLEVLRRVYCADAVENEDAWRAAALDMGMKLTEAELTEFYSSFTK